MSAGSWCVGILSALRLCASGPRIRFWPELSAIVALHVASDREAEVVDDVKRIVYRDRTVRPCDVPEPVRLVLDLESVADRALAFPAAAVLDGTLGVNCQSCHYGDRLLALLVALEADQERRS